MTKHTQLIGSDTLPDSPGPASVLSDRLLARLAQYGEERYFATASELPHGSEQPDLYVVLRGTIKLLFVSSRKSSAGAFSVLSRGQFTGELGLLGGRRTLLMGRVTSGSRVLRISRAALARVMQQEAEIGDIMMQAWMSRRVAMVKRGRGGAIILGIGNSASMMRLQQFLGRNDYPNRTIDARVSPNGGVLLDALALSLNDLPVLFLPNQRVFRNPSNSEVAKALGLKRDIVTDEQFDVAIVGAGPSGLAAAVYAASEGLHTILIEMNAPGGQAGTSSKIENYLGFPAGVTGQDLASRAEAQVRRFGGRLEVSRQVVGLQRQGRGLLLFVDGGESISCRSAIIATGARYRKLPIERSGLFELQSIHYAATAIEANHCAGRTVLVIGGGNSAGQAALHLSSRAKHVHLVVRGGTIAETMSDYLVQRLASHDGVTIHLHSEVTSICGQSQLRSANVTDRMKSTTKAIRVSDMFVLIGADPNTDWLQNSLNLDRHGFIIAGNASFSSSQYATSLEGVFAIGDVRSGSIKRIASAVGEGSAVVADVHRFLSLASRGPVTPGKLEMPNSVPAKGIAPRRGRKPIATDPSTHL
jgi:thioredoxin reductase (NADPH)